MAERTYTADQVATAARELRALAGTEEEQFSATQVVAMLGDEVRLLRERGFTDEKIADAFAGIGVQVTADEIRDAPDGFAEVRAEAPTIATEVE